jgi:hypothetical protein
MAKQHGKNGKTLDQSILARFSILLTPPFFACNNTCFIGSSRKATIGYQRLLPSNAHA